MRYDFLAGIYGISLLNGVHAVELLVKWLAGSFKVSIMA